MVRLLSVVNVRNAFYECADCNDIEGMTDYFETLYLHYLNRGKRNG